MAIDVLPDPCLIPSLNLTPNLNLNPWAISYGLRLRAGVRLRKSAHDLKSLQTKRLIAEVPFGLIQDRLVWYDERERLG